MDMVTGRSIRTSAQPAGQSIIRANGEIRSEVPRLTWPDPIASLMMGLFKE